MMRLFPVLTLLAAALAPPVLAEVPRVVTDMPITQSLVVQVMGDLGTPDQLLDRGADLHDFQLRPSQARLIAGADLVVWMSADLTPWMARATQTLARGATLELAGVAGLALQGFQPGRVLPEAEGDGHEHEQEHGLDPHLWLDPQNIPPLLRAVAAELTRQDPDHAARYASNAEAAVLETLALHAELADILAPAAAMGLITHHDAYGYLARAFGLDVLGAVTSGDAADPGAARISALRTILATLDTPPCLFPEVNHSDAFVALVAEGLPVRLGLPLDPEGATLPPGASLYGGLMRQLAQRIAACANGT